MVVLASPLLFAAALAALSPDSAELRRTDLMTALKGGGFTILMRHAATDWSVQEDRVNIPVERDKQRNLSEEGIRQAKLMGAVLTRYQIPIGEIVTSPMFRTRETAQYAVGAPTRTTMDLRVMPSTAAQAALVAAAPAPGTNRFLVTHHFVIETHAPGIRPGDIKEGEGVVLRPTGDGKVTLVGRITLDDWESLAGTGGATASARPASYPEAAPGAAHPAVAVAIPDTKAGRLARDYLVVFNAGDAPRMRTFLETMMVPNPHRTNDERLERYLELYEQHGPITVTAIRKADDDQVELTIRTRKGEMAMTVTAATEPGKLTSVTFTMTQRGPH